MKLTSLLGKLSNLTSLILNETKMLKPYDVYGMIELNREKFTRKIQIPKVYIEGVKISDVLIYFKPYLLKLQHFKAVQSKESSTILFLDPLRIKRWDDIELGVQNNLKKFSINESNLKMEDFELKYDYFTAEDILRAVLPSDKEGMASFTQIGHIIHVNLREHLLPFKKLIGEVLLDKISGCETVVNKINNIDNTYRNFSMEVLCGKNETKTSLKENNCIFEFDFATVYWNSRLSTEHERIVKIIQQGNVLFDVFAGVGPFSIPCAKKKCDVYANDLNPESYFWLNHNVKKNKVNLKSYNLDGHDFIENVIKKELLQHINNKKQVYIVMNLPALAVEFLHHFKGMYSDGEIKEMVNPPVIFVYCFAKGENFEEITKEMIKKNLGVDLGDKLSLFRVRTVSSFKEMMRVSFKLDEELLVNYKKGEKRSLEED
nr:tRNA (guanine(37)-N1)-methyltransferase [Onthophagus taurus]